MQHLVTRVTIGAAAIHPLPTCPIAHAYPSFHIHSHPMAALGRPRDRRGGGGQNGSDENWVYCIPLNSR